MMILQMIQLNIMFTMMTWQILIIQLFYHYKTFTFALMLPSLFWDSFPNLIVYCWEKESIWMKIHHRQNVIYKHVFNSKRLYYDIKGGYHWGTRQKMIYDQDKKTRVYKFQVGYMKHSMMKTIWHMEIILSRCYHPYLKSIQQYISNNCW